MPKKYLCCGCRRYVEEDEAENNKLTHDGTGDIYTFCDGCFDSIYDYESVEEESEEEEESD